MKVSQYSLISILCLDVIEKTTIVHEWLISFIYNDAFISDVFTIGSLLLRHVLQLVCNAHAITAVLPTLNKGDNSTEGGRVEREEQVRIATAIYPTASLMNHSCDPTIISRCVIIAFVHWILIFANVRAGKSSANSG